ncbi:hypothetical protein RN001_012886 [Aquatica leii]|uniref:Uncharacterized protein n=1 Tax=Aquatica leii TaxID=1421715 RepID=A0AAN7SFF8_9COLE|nr:hypothetical protein RN001_012886 [Aquatica leii]
MRSFLVVFVAVWGTIQATNVTQQQNITKRGVNDQVTYYTDPIQVRFIQTPVYRDVPPTNAPSTHLYINPKVETDYAKQVAVQQLLYDYPAHQFHSAAPSNGIPDHVQAPTHLLNHQPNFVTPIQHGAVINHGQSYSKYVYPVAVPQTNTPGYPYVNKFIYPRPNVYPQHPAPVVTQKPFKPSPLIFISKPVIKPAAVKEETDEEPKTRKSNVKDEDDDNEELENYEEDDEDDYKTSKYRYEDDEDDDDVRGRYRDDDDEDNTRSYSRNVRQKPRKYSYGNKYSSSKKPKSQYKSYRYSNYSKPKKDTLESRQTENIPVIHKHNSFRQEKWIVTKKD